MEEAMMTGKHDLMRPSSAAGSSGATIDTLPRQTIHQTKAERAAAVPLRHMG